MEKNIPEHNISQILEVERLFHEPARIAILSLLYVVESADFLFIMNQTGLTQGNLSSHLNKLEESSVIEVIKSFAGKRPRTTIKLTAEGRLRFKNYVDSVKDFFGSL
ncbi:MAG: hypothetical protein AMS27_11845 [Bacteroides sp. SM23_62_1]|nr:MAG: hypothetical protein AMS27_11845 [Bacteroides sp. SM23_62_1]